MIAKPLIALLLVLSAGAAPATDIITEQALRAHITMLASDEYEGRAPGTTGGDKAVTYIARALAKAGLTPGGADGSWYLPVPLVERRPAAARLAWSARGETRSLNPTDMILIDGEASVEIDAPVLFAGYALGAPSAEVRGAVVLMLPGAPDGLKNAPAFSARRDALLAAGAAAVLVLRGPDEDWAAVVASAAVVQTTLAATPFAGTRGGVRYAAWTALLSGLGETPASLRKAALAPGFRPRPIAARVRGTVTTQVRRYDSYNVLGRIKGTGGGRESLLFLAHWDHLGLCRPEGAPDRICNGAVDNASGTALLIETARALAAGKRPVRDIVFLATTAEELGLLGARAFAAAPPVPLASIVAALNYDTNAIGPRGLPVAIIGRGSTPALDAEVDAAARALGRKVDEDREANALAHRQDGAAFLEAGVPTVMVGGSFSDMALLGRYLSGGPYHKPDDELNERTELGGAAEDGTLHVALARRLADPKRYAPAPR